jgi:hypothetical protein
MEVLSPLQVLPTKPDGRNADRKAGLTIGIFVIEHRATFSTGLTLTPRTTCLSRAFFSSIGACQTSA